MNTVDIRCAVKFDAFTLALPWAGARLPFRGWVATLDDRPRDKCGRARSHATMPGFRKGVKPANTGLKYQPKPLTDEDVLTLIYGCSRTSSTGLRNRALIALLYRSGLRISEALDLAPGDLDHDARTVLVRRGKGGKTRLVGMDGFGWDHLEPWMTQRTKLGVDPHSGPVFCTIAKPFIGDPLGAPYVRTMLKRLAAVAEMGKRVHPHAFRHGLAFGMAQEGVPIPVISKQLGHSNIATTSTYLSHVDPTMLVDAVCARPAVGA